MARLWNRDLPEDGRVCSDVIKCGLLVLDDFPEGADGLCTCNLNWKYLASIIAEYLAVELNRGRHQGTTISV